MGQTAGVVDKFVAVAFAIFKLIFSIDNDRVVGVAYLADSGAVQEFAVAGDCENTLGFVLVLFVALLIKVGVNGDGTSK